MKILIADVHSQLNCAVLVKTANQEINAQQKTGRFKPVTDNTKIT